jgi:hypothetical protein
MAPKLILWNGPRKSGKDTASLYCEAAFKAHHFKMSGPIKAAIKAMFGFHDQEVEYLESIKVDSTFLLFGRSYVETQISFSETWAKPLFGKHVFGDMAARHLRAAMREDPTQQLYVCSDSGFAAEALPVIDLFGKQNTLLVKIHREGKTFAGDSRSYIELEGVQTLTLLNNGTTEQYYEVVHQLVQNWIDGKIQ